MPLTFWPFVYIVMPIANVDEVLTKWHSAEQVLYVRTSLSEATLGFCAAI